MSRRVSPLAVALVALGLALARPSRPRPKASSRSTISSLTLFAGTAEGLWRSTNWGGSWQRVARQRDERRAPRRARRGRATIVPSPPTSGWRATAASSSRRTSASPGRSSRRWAASRAVLAPRWPQADPTVFVGTGRACCARSTRGKTWERRGARRDGRVARIEWPGPAWSLACDKGLLVTMDEGATYAARARGCPAGPVVAMALSSYFAVDPVLFAAPASGGVFRSSDGGRKWAAVGPRRPEGERPRLARAVPLRRGRGRASSAARTSGATWTRLVRQPGPARPPDVSAGARGGHRGVPRHRPRPLSHERRRRALDAVRASRASRCSTSRRSRRRTPSGARSRAGEVHEGPRPRQRLHPGRGEGRAGRPHPSGRGGSATVTAASAATASCCTGPRPTASAFFLVNADGLPGEISGNGLRCLAALAVRGGLGGFASHRPHRRRPEGRDRLARPGARATASRPISARRASAARRCPSRSIRRRRPSSTTSSTSPAARSSSPRRRWATRTARSSATRRPTTRSCRRSVPRSSATRSSRSARTSSS